MNHLSVLGANNEYVQQTKDYGKKDALFAIILYVVMILGLFFLGKIFVHRSSTITEIYIFCVTGIASLLSIGLVFLFCFIRKQKFVTVGFSKTQAQKSLVMGLVLSVIVIIMKGNMVIHTVSIIKTDIFLFINKFIYYLVFIAFMEEITIRGYIGTRLYGYFSDKRLSIIIVGILFSLEHIPFHMVISKMDLLEYLSVNWGNLIYFFITHIIVQWLYSKHNSIIAPTILHFILDFSL